MKYPSSTFFFQFSLRDLAANSRLLRSPEARQMMTMMGRESQVPSEYNLDRAVYFLNEAALKMFRESGEDIEVLETISADEFSDFNLPGPQLRGPYIPKE